MERRYDLVISIEVAEHLRPERAETLVDDLTHLADLVLFSTAIPGQGGAHHLNEPSQSHWARLFGEPGYTVIDILHPPALRDARKPRGVGHQLTRQAPAAPRHTIRRLDPHGERRQRQAALSAMRIVNRKSQSS
jgi:hypothetical protein